MKKLFSLIVIVLFFSSCQEEVKFNNPGFQAYKDDVLWRAASVVAYKSETGALRIEASAEDGEIVLSTVGTNIGAYYLGSVNDNTAEYNNSPNDLNLFYSSSDDFGPILNIANVVTAGGTGYTASNFASTTSTRGNNEAGGSGMKVKTFVNNQGNVTLVSIVSPGSGYEIGDLMTITGGDNKAKFKILSEIVITDNSNNTISGTFKFNAVNVYSNPLGEELVNFQYGTFYKVPVVPEP